MTSRDEHKGNGFGARFGRLVRSYRDDLGVSTRDLAVRVWNDEGRKATISRLENGRVQRPAAKTVQAIAHALDIPQEEIDSLRRPDTDSSGALATHLESLSRAGRDLLEALAARFEIGRPFEYSDVQLRELLELKAEEYRRYHRVITEEGGTIQRIALLKTKADEASRALDFAGCEACLREAEKAQVLLTAELREARARNALLRGQTGLACEVFESAAEAFRDLDLLEMARRRNEYHGELSQHGIRYGGEGLASAIKMQRPGVEALEATDWRDEWAEFLKNMANSLAHLGDRTGGAEGVRQIEEAVASYRKVLLHFTYENNPRKWATTQQNLGGALYLLNAHCDEAAEKRVHLEESIDAFRGALRVRDKSTSPYDWAVTMQNLGAALKDLGVLVEGPEGRKYICQATETFNESLTIRTREDYPFEWAMTCENLAHAEFALASREVGGVRETYRTAALEHITAAIGIYGNNAPYFLEKATRFRNDLLGDSMDAQP